MTDFYPIKTDDGSLSLFNNEVGDVYHSSIGAYKESLEKFIFPSNILDFVRNNDEVYILDVCYGMGYNSFAAIEEILKVNPNCKINIYALEYDISVLAFSVLVEFEKVKSNFIQFIKKGLLSFDKINAEMNNLTLKYQISPSVLSLKDNSSTFVHNIYYRTISNRTSLSEAQVKIPEIHIEINKNINFHLFIADARDSIMLIHNKIDFIFQDPFTPSKLPTLWSVEFFKCLYNLLKQNGNLTTYSAASPIRSGLIEAGFLIAKTEPVGRKNCGTIAYKDSEATYKQLTEEETGLLETNAGIPYYDMNLSATAEDILSFREEMISYSTRQSTSSYFKSLNKIKD
ncbi:MAG: MnmC family methyltransferase [bacterium]